MPSLAIGEMPLVGALGRLLGCGATSVTPPPTTTSSVPPLERTISVLPAGTGNGPRVGRAGILVRGRQDDRRLAGIDRRRHPGIDPDIGRRQHAVPVERRGDAHRALVAGGDIGRHHHHHDQRAQRPGIVDREPRRRQAGADALDRGQRALALLLPQRQRDRVLRSPAYRSARSPGDGGCRCRGRAGQAPLRGSASESATAGTARQAPAARTGRAPMARAINGSASHNPAQDTTRNSPTTVKSRARCGQARSHAMAYLARCRACVSLQPRDARPARAPASDGSGVAPFNKLSGLPNRQPSTTAAMRHPFRAVTHTRNSA